MRVLRPGSVCERQNLKKTPLKWLKATLAKCLLSDIFAAHVLYQHIGYLHGAVGLLVILQYGGYGAAYGYAGAVEGVHKLRLGALSRRKRIWARRAWKSSKLEQELISTYLP